MFVFVLSIHVIVCALLIFIVMIQQGKGGGLIDSFSSAESIFGTKTNTFLVKTTTTLSIIFFVTCLSLAFLSIQRNKSLIGSAPLTRASGPSHAESSAPAAPVTPGSDIEKKVSEAATAAVAATGAAAEESVTPAVTAVAQSEKPDANSVEAVASIPPVQKAQQDIE